MHVLWSYAKGFTKEIILAPSLKLLEACFELAVPFIMANVLDDLLLENGRSSLPLYLGLLFFFACFGWLVAVLAQFYAAKVAVGVSSRLSKDLVAKSLRLSQCDRDKFGVASLVNRVTSDTLQLQIGINLFLRLFLRAPIIVFGAWLMAFRISPRLSLSFIVMIACLFLSVYLLTSRLSPLYQQIRHLFDRLVVRVREQVIGMAVIRSFGRSDDELAEFISLDDQLLERQVKAAQYSSFLNPLTFLIVNVTLIALLVQGYFQIQLGNLSQGMLIALVNYLSQILVELLKVTMLWQSLGQSYISAQRLVTVLALPIEENIRFDPNLTSQESLLVQDLTFRYAQSSEPALKSINFKLEQGQNLGIIGGTGAGKTSLVNLLVRTYPIDLGWIGLFIDGKLPRDLHDWRDKIALVPQKAVLFKGTIRSNLTLGLKDTPEDAKLWWALRLAQAESFVKERHEQLDSQIGSFGQSLSGGQKQRLMIARAILQDKPFLILDDATSALDYLTEQSLLSALRTELPNQTLIIVSQRIRIVSQMDRVLVLENGRQMGYASHDELERDNTVYQAIIKSQQGLEEEGNHVS